VVFPCGGAYTYKQTYEENTMADTIHSRTPLEQMDQGGDRHTRAVTGGNYDNTTQTTLSATITSGSITNIAVGGATTGLLTLLNADGSDGQYVGCVAGPYTTNLFPTPLYAPNGFKFRIIQGSGASASGSVSWTT
jgi:hypothetical protein